MKRSRDYTANPPAPETKSTLSTSSSPNPLFGPGRAQPTLLPRSPPQGPQLAQNAASQNAPSSSSAFRNVSACNRCRLRKNRCDQQLPSCSACEKVGAKCVGYDPITKREIPRSFVFYLESRVAYLEKLLNTNGIQFEPPENFALGAQSSEAMEQIEHSETSPHIKPEPKRLSSLSAMREEEETAMKSQKERDKVEDVMSNIGMVSVQGTSDARYLGATSGISFARVVLAAVKHSVNSTSRATSEKGGTKPSKLSDISSAAAGSSMRDSFFGLQTKPTIKEAPFPERELGLKLAQLYFEHANPQMPILHRPEFMRIFDRVYSNTGRKRSSRESYMLNIVFAIGAGIIMEGPDRSRQRKQSRSESNDASGNNAKKQKMSNEQFQPEEYHASAIVHLGDLLGSTSSGSQPDGFGGGLEELQSVLLLASFALLRPVAPGLWYIVGVAVRLAIDLGLHYEEGSSIVKGQSSHDAQEIDANAEIAISKMKISEKELGRREWIRDLRRRLWWCAYSFDRLVSFCVGRPFGVSDQVVTTEFPSPLDDKYITVEGFKAEPSWLDEPSYKRVSHHYFRLRLLQSEIVQVLQYIAAQNLHASRTDDRNPFMHTQLPSPFLVDFPSFLAWRKNMDQRLWEWKESAPTQEQAGVQFNPLFLELNYWQAVIALYRQSLTTPSPLAEDTASVNDNLASPIDLNIDESGNEEHIYLTIAEAGQRVMKIYRQLHRLQLVNYTFLATHHLFMSGIAFLFAIWHSSVVRSRLTLDDVDFTVLAATSVFEDLSYKCPPAEACKEAFTRMAKATIQRVISSTGFATTNTDLSGAGRDYALAEDQQMQSDTAQSRQGGTSTNPMFPSLSRRPPPKFDMDFKDLFAENELGPYARRFSVALQNPQLGGSSIPSRQVSSGAHETEAFGNLPQDFSFDNDTSQSQQQPSMATTGFDQTSVPQLQLSQDYQQSYPEQLDPTYATTMDGLNDLDFLDAFSSSGRGDWADGSYGNLSDASMNMFGIERLDGGHDWMDPGGGPELMPWDGFFFRSG